jgi:hypothetical protein
MKPTKRSLLVCIIGLPLVIALSLSGKQTASAAQAASAATSDEEANLKAYETLLRSDVNAQREPVVKEIMNLSDSDGAKFWPVYHEYEAERAKLDQAEAQLLTNYAKNYQTTSDHDADQMMSKEFELEAQRTALKKKYYGTMKKDVSAPTAAKFFEVDSQLQHISDLQTASKLPTNQ